MATNIPGEEDPKKRRAPTDGFGFGAKMARAALTGPGIGDAAAAALGMMGRNPTLQPPSLPDYGRPPVSGQASSASVGNSNPPASAAKSGAVTDYDQMPPDRVQQGIAARAPVLTAPDSAPNVASHVGDSGLNVARGFGQLALGTAGAVAAPILDTARNGITRLAGGNPETLPGGSSGFYNSAMENIREGWEPIAAGGRQIGAGIRGLLGAAQAQEGPASTSASPASTLTVQKKPAAPRAAAAEQPEGLGFRQTGIDGVVGRRNAQGVMEFSNAKADVAGASGERLGIGDIGDGIGGLSVGQAGDAQASLDRFERANGERGLGFRGRPQEIGDTGNFTIVEDGTRGTQEERDMKAHRRLKYGTDVAMERNRLEAQQLRQSGINSYLDRQLREREVASAEQTGALQRQRTEQELQAGALDLTQRQQIADLRAQLADPNIQGEARQRLLQTYNALATSPNDRLQAERESNQQRQKLVADLFKTYSENRPMGEDNKPVPFWQWAQPALQMLGGQQGGSVIPQAAIQALRANPKQAAEFDQKYGAGAAARYLGG